MPMREATRNDCLSRTGLLGTLLLALAWTSCGGGGGGDSVRFQIRFQPSSPPAAGTVALQEGGFSASSRGGAVYVAVVLTDTSGVFGTDFDLIYDAANFSFIGASEGTFLNANGTVPTDLLVAKQSEPPTTERIIVGYFREGLAVTDVDAVGQQVLLVLQFRPRVGSAVASALEFDGTLRSMRVVSKDGTVVVDETGFHGGTLYVDVL